jgi:hypothetical protein
MMAAILRNLRPLTGVEGSHIMVANMAKDPPTFSNFPSIHGHPVDNQAVSSMCSSDDFMNSVFSGKVVRRGAKDHILSIRPEGVGIEPPTEAFCQQLHIDHEYTHDHWCFDLDLTTVIEEGSANYKWAREVPLKAGTAMAASLKTLLGQSGDSYTTRKAAIVGNYQPFMEPLTTPAEAFQPLFIAKPDNQSLPWQALGFFKGLAGLFWKPCHFLKDDGSLASPPLLDDSIPIAYKVVYWLASTEQCRSARYILRFIYNVDPSSGDHAMGRPEAPIPRLLIPHPSDECIISSLEALLNISIFEYHTSTADLVAAGLFGPAMRRLDYAFAYHSSNMGIGEIPLPPYPSQSISSSGPSMVAAAPVNSAEANASVQQAPATLGEMPAAADAGSVTIGDAVSWDPQEGMQLATACSCSRCCPSYSPEPFFDPTAPSTSAAAEAAAATTTAAAAAKLASGVKRIREDTPLPRLVKIKQEPC